MKPKGKLSSISGYMKTSNNIKVLKWAAISSLLLIATCSYKISPVQSIFNCFTPNMFKMGKGASGYQQQTAIVPQPVVGPYSSVGGGPERAHWYPRYQQQQMLQVAPMYQMPVSYAGYQQPGKGGLFGNKWRNGGIMGGGGLFGMKRWNKWRMMQNNNFYRPGYGYGGGASNGYMSMPQYTYSQGSYPMAALTNHQSYGYGSEQHQNPLGHSTASYSPSINSADGWSISTVVPGGYTASRLPSTTTFDDVSYGTQLPLKSYGSALSGGGGGSAYGLKSGGNKYGTKSTLLANGGYDSFDAHLPISANLNQLANGTFGYAYPEWYSGVVESPAKIAQQLLKQGFKRQQYQNRSSPLVLAPKLTSTSGSSTSTTASQFTILDEPRFVGYGNVDLLNNKEARLSCSFSEAIDQTNQPLWVKFSGPYNSSTVVNGKVVPPFNCANSLCRTQEVETNKDYRYKFDNGPATSTLIIGEPRLSDYGIYRCSALTKTLNNNPIETIYQIVRFGNL